MKIVKWLVLIVVILVMVGGTILYLNLNSIIRKQVETQASSSLNLATTLGAADLSLFGGEVKLRDLQIASPPGYTAPKMFTLGGTAVKVNYGQLRQEPIHVTSINISNPTLVIEQKNGQFNFKAALDGMPKSDTPAPKPDDSGKTEKPMKLIIDDLSVDNATVIIRPGDVSSVPGLSALTSALPKEITIPVASINLKNIGNADGNNNGAAVKDVVMQVITALTDSASKSGALPDQLKSLMNLNLDGAKAQLGAAFQKQIGGLTKSLPAGVGDVVKDPNALIKDPGKAIQGLTGGADANGPTSKPADALKNAENGLGGLLGGKKK